MAEIVNVYSVAAEGGSDQPVGYRRRLAPIGPALGAHQLGATVYELDAGESVCPYHWEGVEEEWLLVLSGTPTLRTPEGERELSEGDVACFLAGPKGAHKITNHSDQPVRILMLSNQLPNDISICVYPDSQKVSVDPPGKRFRFEDEVSYWEGEL